MVERKMGTKYKIFQNYIQAKQTREKISSLVYLDGAIVNNERDVSNEIISFYKVLLGSTDLNCTGGDPIALRSLLTSTLPLEAANQLVLDVTAKEIFKVFKDIPKKKISRPDGYTTEFVIAAWEIVGDLMTSAIKEFFFLPLADY